MAAALTTSTPHQATFRRPILTVTLGLWACSFVLHTIWLVVSRGGLPAWGVPYLGALVLLGLLFCAALVTLERALRSRPAPLRWTVLAVTALALSTIHACVDPVVYRIVLPAFGAPVRPVALTTIVTNLLVYVWLYGLYAAVLEIMSAMQAVLAHARHAAEARAMAQEARLQALRLQLNPHFLFNTLNAISGAVLAGNTPVAEGMLSKLSSFLRATLAGDQAALVPLSAELGMVEAYLEIEEVRFGPRLEVDVDGPLDLHDALVPSFILQPLVENAVTHAIAPAGGAGRIDIHIRADGGRLVVAIRDSVAGDVPPAANGSGLGLQNVRDRLSEHYGDRASLTTTPSENGFTARLELPLERMA